VNGNPAAWIILLAVACAVVIAVPTGLWVSWRRERSWDYNPAHRARRQPPSSGPGRRDRPGCHRPITPIPGKRDQLRSYSGRKALVSADGAALC
jgi:hypothetical protein